MSRIMRKPAFCICENKDPDQLHSYCAVNRHICWFFFRYLESTTPILSKPRAIFCGRSAWIVSELVRNPEDRFSRNTAHMKGTMSNEPRPEKTCLCSVLLR